MGQSASRRSDYAEVTGRSDPPEFTCLTRDRPVSLTRALLSATVDKRSAAPYRLIVARSTSVTDNGPRPPRVTAAESDPSSIGARAPTPRRSVGASASASPLEERGLEDAIELTLHGAPRLSTLDRARLESLLFSSKSPGRSPAS